MKGAVAILYTTGILLSNICPMQVAAAISMADASAVDAAMSPMDANSCQKTESHARWDGGGDFSCSEGHCITTVQPQASGFAAAGQEVTTGGSIVAGSAPAPSIIHAIPAVIASEERPPPLRFIATVILRA